MACYFQEGLDILRQSFKQILRPARRWYSGECNFDIRIEIDHRREQIYGRWTWGTLGVVIDICHTTVWYSNPVTTRLLFARHFPLFGQKSRLHCFSGKFMEENSCASHGIPQIAINLGKFVWRMVLRESRCSRLCLWSILPKQPAWCTICYTH